MKVKKKPKAMCYAEELKRWISVKEAVRRHYHPEEFEDDNSLTKKMRKELKKEKKVAAALVDFFEMKKNSYNLLNFSIFRDYKDGEWTTTAYVYGSIGGVDESAIILDELEEELKWEGLTLEDITRNAIIRAKYLYKQKNPPFPKTNGVHPRYIETKMDLNRATGKYVSKREKIFDQNISAVIQRLAIEGFTQKEVRKVMDHYDIDVKETTIKGQMWCGLKGGKYLKAAKLSDDQIDELMDIVSE